MEHKMKLTPLPFQQIVNGDKTVELRLYDEKRQKIKIGDTILFSNTQSDESVEVEVVGLYIFPTFEMLQARIPPVKYGGYTLKELEKHYNLEKQQKFNVVGIEIKLI